jgi:RNA polymerase sigma-B factor
MNEVRSRPRDRGVTDARDPVGMPVASRSQPCEEPVVREAMNDVAGLSASAPRHRLTEARPPTTSELFARWRIARDDAAREELVRRHLSLAHKLASRYKRTQEPFDDLFQVASLGLLKAIDRFDPDRGIAFSSFAVPTMLGELKRHFRDKGFAVHLPRGLQELVLRVQEAEREFGSRLGRSPTVDELAGYLDADEETVLEALQALVARRAVSLDTPAHVNNGDELTAIRHDTVGVEDDRYALIETAASLAGAARALGSSDRQVLALYVGHGLIQREIAERIGVSQMQVSRILRRAKERLRAVSNIT